MAGVCYAMVLFGHWHNLMNSSFSLSS